MNMRFSPIDIQSQYPNSIAPSIGLTEHLQEGPIFQGTKLAFL